ncbi:MAG: hypothetical protein CM1200mP16_13460 [Nitrospina sp.]|nr:MAG: hypothetical protein CM1200mP16_13460 [Nitrospina sp.]
MPGREKNLYTVWKELSLEDDSGIILGIQDWKAKFLVCRINLKMRYLKVFLFGHSQKFMGKLLFLAVGPVGWLAGFIKWRAEQTNYDWQNAFPADLIPKYGYTAFL